MVIYNGPVGSAREYLREKGFTRPTSGFVDLAMDVANGYVPRQGASCDMCLGECMIGWF